MIKPKPEPTWKMRDGTVILIKDMTDSHLDNTIKMLDRKAKAAHYAELTAGYAILGTLQGEMAIDDVERGINQMEENGPCPEDHFPVYMDLVAEQSKRELNRIIEGRD